MWLMELHCNDAFLYHYKQIYPIKNMRWKELQEDLEKMPYCASIGSQWTLLKGTIFAAKDKFSPPLSYKRQFLKKIISVVEDAKVEVDEDLYEEYVKVLAESFSPSTEFCYKTYLVDDKFTTITLKESCNLISSGTTGMCTWEASHILKNFCIKEKGRFREKKILELGAGLGLTGLSLVYACNPAVYRLTDSHESVLRMLSENVVINRAIRGPHLVETYKASIPSDDEWSRGRVFGLNIHQKQQQSPGPFVKTKVRVSKLDWSEGVCDYKVDYVLAADVVYDNEVTKHLVTVLKYIFNRKPKVQAFVACAIRHPETFAYFKELLVSENLHIHSEKKHEYQDPPSQSNQTVVIVHIVLNPDCATYWDHFLEYKDLDNLKICSASSDQSVRQAEH